jgi:ferric-dicitrate binding protein FerR (iron transport regulator)
MDHNVEQALRASELIVKYLENSLEDDEPQELDSWTEESEENRLLFSELTDPEQLQMHLLEFDRINAGKKAAWRKVKRQIFIRKLNIFRFIPLVALRYVAAAALVGGIVFTGIYNQQQGSKETARAGRPTDPKSIPVGDGNSVVLTLGNGSSIALDSTRMGLLAQEGGANILKQQGDQILYDAGTQSTDPVERHAVQTPKGKTYRVILPDGSKVTLNALTKLEYPTAFTKDKRNITLSEGEAYFEIVNDNNKPFQVDVAGMNITVIGTQFNVNAYKNEPSVKSTLFEGGVRITDNNTLEVNLKPGQQLIYDTVAKGFKIERNADLDATAAWLNNLFNLDNADVPTLMREIGRWYDVDIVYANGIPKGHFEGQIPRNMDFPELLKVLNAGGIKTKLDGRKLIVY